MILRRLTAGSITGTGTLTVESQIVGGILLTADGTNAASVTLQRDTSGGTKIIELSSTISMWISGPFGMEETETLYYAISGTGGSAQLYEWVT